MNDTKLTIFSIKMKFTIKGKLQITPLKFGVNWILHSKISET